MKWQTPQERFWSKVLFGAGADACHIWVRGKSNGYGRFNLDGFTWQAHRLAWTWEHGPIPEGLEPDHRCRNRACVRTSHMELVTHAENVARGIPNNGYAARTHCPKRHPYDEVNTYWRRTPKGWGRGCRQCRREQRRARRLPR